MSWSLQFVQLLNGIQLGLLLFLLGAGLTLVLGIMNFVNLTHGSLYMVGAYFAASLYNWSGSFLVVLAAVPATLVFGMLLERICLITLYRRDHLDQVLATFGLILFLDELVRAIWGPAPQFMVVPPMLSGTIGLFGIPYPAYRFLIICVGLAVALAVYLIIHKTRVGMLIRAGANNRDMVGALGVNIGRLNSIVFGFGAALAGLAGVMAGPILAIQPGMGAPILILTLVVIVVGGIGSIQGAFYAALIIGVVDTVGRTALPLMLRQLIEPSLAQAAGPPIASMLIYILMAVVLAFRPQGLFPVRH